MHRAIEQAAFLGGQGRSFRRQGRGAEFKAGEPAHFFQGDAGVEAGQQRRLGRVEGEDALGGDEPGDAAGALGEAQVGGIARRGDDVHLGHQPPGFVGGLEQHHPLHHVGQDGGAGPAGQPHLGLA